MATEEDVRCNIKEYYGKVLTCTTDQKVHTDDEKTNRQIVNQSLCDVHPDVQRRYFGCGIVVPEHLRGMNVLDLGSGCGRDSFAVSKLVGESGSVTGVDMTEEQVEFSRRYIDYHTKKFDFTKENTKFVQGFLEDLTGAGLEKEFYDIAMSNCVINLCKDKKMVLSGVYSHLKVGGELYFSDMYADQEVPKYIQEDPLLWNEGFGGALWWKTFVDLVTELGFSKPRIVTGFIYDVEYNQIRTKIDGIKYASVTYRLFKLPAHREPTMLVTYKGNIPGYEEDLDLDHGTMFTTGQEVKVESDLATILKSSRFMDAFEFGQPLPDETDTTVHIDDPFQYINRKRLQ